jgi:hypothetical protein
MVLRGRRRPSKRFLDAVPAAFEELSLLSQAKVFELAGIGIELEQTVRRRRRAIEIEEHARR